MDAIYIERLRFPNEVMAQRYLVQCQEQEERYTYAGAIFKRTRVGDYIYEYHYSSVRPEYLDGWFAHQMKAKDALISMPGSGKLETGLVGTMNVTVGLIDGDEDEDYDDEDFYYGPDDEGE